MRRYHDSSSEDRERREQRTQQASREQIRLLESTLIDWLARACQNIQELKDKHAFTTPAPVRPATVALPPGLLCPRPQNYLLLYAGELNKRAIHLRWP
jgi:hypothetical protein